MNKSLRHFLGVCGLFLLSVTSAWAAPGDLDPAFGTGGQAFTNFQTSETSAWSVAVQGDGKMVVAQPSGVLRYNGDGSLDTTFNSTGRRAVGNSGASVAVQGDGKLLVAGIISTASDSSVERFQGDGTKDITMSLGGFGSVKAVAAQADGKVVAAVDGLSRAYSFTAVRFNANGTLDTTFNGTGWVRTYMGDVGGNYFYLAECNGMAVQGDGKIVLVGTVWPDSAPSTPHIALIRLNANGSLDTTFNGTGRVMTPVGSAAYGYAAVVRTDGSILVAGKASNGINMDFVLLGYNADGTLQAGFGSGGWVLTDFGGNETGRSMSLRTDGKIVIAGTSDVGGNSMVVAQYDGNGSPDTGFNGTGKATAASAKGQGVAIQGAGKVVVAGSSSAAAGVLPTLFRYNTDGSPDTSLQGSGRVVADYWGRDDFGNCMALQPDGKALVAGNTTGAGGWFFAVSRYNQDGSTDTTFNGTGRQVIKDFTVGSTDPLDQVDTMAVRSDGKILLAGITRRSNTNVYTYGAMVRLNPDGTLDMTFNGTGKKLLPSAGNYNIALRDMKLQADGKILGAGGALYRLNEDGSADTSFNGTGIVNLSVPGDGMERIAVQGDGRIVAAGSNSNGTTTMVLSRYNADGSADTSFNGTGRMEGPADFKSTGVALQADGKILVSAIVRKAGVLNAVGLVRVNANGTLDTTFNGTGTVTTLLGDAGQPASATGVAVQSNGKIVVGGYASSGGKSYFASLRYNASGSLDTTYHGTGIALTPVGGTWGGSTCGLAVQNDGNILIGGYAHGGVVFNGSSPTDGGSYDFALVRLNGGTPVTYAITTSASPLASGGTSGGGTVAGGSSVTVTATPGTGYTFVNWTEGGSPVSTAASYNFTASASRTLVANFTPTTYTVTPSAGTNGSISPNTVQTVNSGGSAPFTATPSSGYVVDQWFVNGASAQTGGTGYTVSNVTVNTTLQVTFKAATISTNANLGSLVPGAGKLSTVFTGGTTSYTASLPKSALYYTVKPTVAQVGATVTVNGTSVASGSSSARITLTIGSSNVITTVVTAPDGTTTQTYTITVTRASTAPVLMDLIGSGKPDLIFQYAGTGQVYAWFLDGTGASANFATGAGLKGTTSLYGGNLAGWQLAAIADVNGDGNPDLVFQNTSTGQVYAWFLDGSGAAVNFSTGAGIKGAGYLYSGSLSGWRLAGVADVNADGNPDLVFQNSSSGQVYAYFLDGSGNPINLATGTGVKGSGYLYSGSLAGWGLASVADVNGDGIPDLVFQYGGTGQVYAWFLDGTGAAVNFGTGSGIRSTGYLYASSLAGWRLANVSDVNGDGIPDLVFQNSGTGQIYAWFLNGTGAPINFATGAGIKSTGYLYSSSLGGWLLH